MEMTDFEAQSGPTIPNYEKKMTTNNSDTILEVKDLIAAPKQSPLPMSNRILFP
jgi:hypothetical protein